MLKNLLILLLTFPILTEWCHSQNVSNDTKLRGIISEKGQAEVIIANQDSPSIDKLTRSFSLISVMDKAIHIILSPLTVERFISEAYEYRIVERPDSKGIISSANLTNAMEWDSYPSYTQYDSIMRFLASSYPLICMLDTIGTSIKGRLVLVLKISDNCKSDETEPEVLFSASIHGDETAGFILMLRFSEYLLRNYDYDARVKDLVDNLEIWINPLANPDGAYRDGNFIISPVRFNANGYDLNRNFPDPKIAGASRQKETLDMMSFLADHRFVLSANFHSGQEVLNYPWDRWPFEHADHEWFNMICRAWADTAHLYSREGYMDFLDNGVTNGYDWYPVFAGRQDYVTYSLNGREITAEIDTNYVTSSSDLDDIWQFNYRSLLGYFENALYGIHGQVIDAINNKPVPAKVSIKGHDKDNSHTYSDSTTGFFSRFLAPGIFDLTFTAEGYRDTTVKNIIVVKGGRTDLTVRINADLNPPDNSDPYKPFFYPNPVTLNVTAVLPENMIGEVKVRMFDLTGKKVSDYDIEAPDEYSVQLDVSRLPAGQYLVIFTKKATKLSCRGSIVIVR